MCPSMNERTRPLPQTRKMQLCLLKSGISQYDCQTWWTHQSSCTHPFQQISCDLITDLPISSSFDSLLVMVDHGLTKGVILCPTKKSITTEGITSLFFYKVFLCFRLFDKVISDCDPQFTSTFTQELGKLLNYDLSLSTAYYPQSNGETEQVNQEIETYLRIICGNNPITWSKDFPC